YNGYDDLGFISTLSAHWCSIGPNNPPSVVAGPDQTITLPTNTVSLNGSSSDDGVPAGRSMSYGWGGVRGRGTVAFSDPTALSTNAQFSAVGQYVVRLVVSDTQLFGYDDTTIMVTSSGAPLLTSVTPSSGQQGQQNLNVAITGQFTHFVQGTTQVSLGG